MEGFLWKKGERGMVKGFKRRWFVLERGGRLRYFEDPSLAKEHGDIDVTRATRVSRGNPAKVRGGAKAFSANVFELEVPGRAYTLIPEQPGALADWVGALSSCVDLSSFRGDLRGIAESASAATTTAMVAVPDSPPGPAPPRDPPPPPSPPGHDRYEPHAAAAASSDRSAGGWDKSRKNSMAARGSRGAEDQAVVGAGRTGGGFFSRMGGSSTGGSVAAPARLRDLEARHAETQDEVATLKQELASLRRERASSGKGRGELGESLLGSSSRSRRASSAASEWDEEADEPEVLPGCGCCGGRCTCKVFFLVMVNILVIATGAGVAGAGVYGLVKKDAFAKIIPVLGMYILLGVGLGFVAVGALGSFGATRFTKASGKMLLLIYVLCMAILTTAELGGSVFLIIDVEGIKLPSEANAAEQQLEVFFGNVFSTCCNSTVAERNGPGCIWVPDDVMTGCPNVTEHAFSERISSLIKSELLPVGGVAAGLVVIHAAAAWFALTLVCPCCCCCCRKKKDKGDAGSGSRDRSRSRAGSTASRRRRQSAYDDDFDD